MDGRWRMAPRIAAALLVLALLAQPIAVMLQGVGVAEAQPNQGVNAAEAYIMRVKKFVNRTLTLAEEYNITLPENLSVRVNVTLSMLEQAEANLSVNVTLAVMLATNASITFGPVADYVWSQLPEDVKKELEIRAMEKAIEARMRVLEKIRERIIEIENMTGANLTELLQAVNQTIQILEQAEQALNMSNTTQARHLIRQATVQLVREVRIATMRAYWSIHRTATINILALHLVKQLNHLEVAVNRTLEAINTSNESIISNLTDILQGLDNRNRMLLERAQRLAEMYPVNDTNDTIAVALALIVDCLNTTQTYLDQAYNASLEGNLTWVATNLTLTLQTLNATLSQLEQLQLPEHVRDMVRQGMHQIRKMHRMEDKVMSHAYSSMSMMLDRKMEKLQRLYEKYQEGKIPAWKYKLILTNEKMQLIALKESLPATAPQWLIQKIDMIINWINEHMP